MRNLARRLRKLEAIRLDVNGLIPNSPAWFSYYEDLLDKLSSGQDIDDARIPLAVIDHLMEQGDSEGETYEDDSETPVPAGERGRPCD